MSAPDNTHGDDAVSVVEVPYRDLSPEALHGLAESFVLREGTDYGEHAYTMAQKFNSVAEGIEVDVDASELQFIKDTMKDFGGFTVLVMGQIQEKLQKA